MIHEENAILGKTLEYTSFPVYYIHLNKSNAIHYNIVHQ